MRLTGKQTDAWEDWLVLSVDRRDSHLLSSNVATLGHGECDGAGGTCRGALAKSPIITSKLGAAGGGLSGSWEHWEPAEDKTVQIGVEKKTKKSLLWLSDFLPLTSPCPLRCTSLPLGHQPCSTFFFTSPSSPFINSSPCPISTFNTWMLGWNENTRSPFLFPPAWISPVSVA